MWDDGSFRMVFLFFWETYNYDYNTGDHMYLSVWMLLPLTASLWCLIQFSISWSLLDASLLYSLVSEYELMNDTFENRWNTKILQSNRTNANMKWNEQISREFKNSIYRFNTLMGSPRSQMLNVIDLNVKTHRLELVFLTWVSKKRFIAVAY